MEIIQIKSALSLKMVLDYYGLKPDKSLRLHCPFHSDKTPSLQVYYKTQTCYCFSSNCTTHGRSMDVIDFILYKENCSKHEAINKAVAILGCYEGKTQHQQKTIQPMNDPQKITISREQFLGNMFTYFKNAVHNSVPAKEYLQSRNINFKKTEVGYNAGQFHHGTRKEESLISSCIEVGLLQDVGNKSRTGDKAYTVFGKYCIVFALRNQSDQITGLYFRSTINDKDPRNAAGQARHFYLKQRSGLYPCYPKKETTKLILTESIIDAATLLQISEIENQYSVLALYGTNGLTAEHLQAIKEWVQVPPLEITGQSEGYERSSREVIFAFDSDEAGNAAVKKYAKQLISTSADLQISTLILPCKDVNETLTAHNEEIFIHLLNERKSVFELKEESVINNENTSKSAHLQISKLDTSHPHKIKYTSDTANYYIQGSLPKTTDHLKIMLVIENKKTGVKARNKIDLYEDRQVEKLCREVSEKSELQRELLEMDLYKMTDLLEQHIEQQLQTADDGQPTTVVLTVKERQELESFAKKPKLIKRLNELLGSAGIVGEERNRIFLLLIAISHKMPETLHALIQGSSGSGKTRLLKQISDCMPKENVTKLTRLSDKVLYNFPENYFVGRLLCLEDIDGLSEEAEFAFRELQSNGELNSATSIKLENGQITSGQKTVKGPIASLACTTRGEIYEDNMSRVFLIAVDEGAEQTKKIIEYQNKKAAGLIDSKKEQQLKMFLQNFVRMLQPYEVINPYAAQIQLPEQAHKIRRLNDLFQSFIKMVTIINQYQRKTDERKRLITQIEDIETAVAVMFESIVLKVDELDGSLRQFYEQLKMYLQKQYNGTHQKAEFTLREVRHALNVSKMQVFRYFNDLQQLEYVRQMGGYANRGFTYKVMYWDNYAAMREKVKSTLNEQLNQLKEQAVLHQ